MLFVIVTGLLGCTKSLTDNLITPNDDEPTITDIGVPTGVISTKTIGTGGGSVLSSDGKAELIFPAGALSGNTTISIHSLNNNAPNGIGNAYRFLPEGLKFAQPVTAKFHYTADNLSATLPEIMGIAFQDSVGVWYCLHNVTNDTSAKVISASISHFSDWTMFDLMQLTPISTSVRVSKAIHLDIQYVEAGKELDELAPLYKKTAQVKWSANGIPNGNSAVGVISGDNNGATFTAPSKLPASNPVQVSAELPFKKQFEGKTFDKLLLVSSITIVDGEKYLLEIKIRETFGSFIYSDSASMVVVINNDDQVVVSDFTNFAPKTNTPTYTLSPCTATWVPDPLGEINVVSAQGTIDGSVGDSTRNLYLQLTHSGAVSPGFTKVCSGIAGSDPSIPMTGLPTFEYFTLTSGHQIYEQDTGDEFDRLTKLQ
jgi:hypothetical protein